MIKLFHKLKAKLIKRKQDKIFLEAALKAKSCDDYIFPWHYDQKN
jgi:hypothetical protein